MYQTRLPFVQGYPKPPSWPSVEEALQESSLAFVIENHQEQGRETMYRHPILQEVAHWKAWDMATRRYTGHVDPDNHGANWLVRMAGYSLPDFYNKDDDANNIESLNYGGNGLIAEVMFSWENSPSHRAHVLGIDKFYRVQTNYGIGYRHDPNSISKHYYVFISAPPEGFYD